MQAENTQASHPLANRTLRSLYLWWTVGACFLLYGAGLLVAYSGLEVLDQAPPPANPLSASGALLSLLAALSLRRAPAQPNALPFKVPLTGALVWLGLLEAIAALTQTAALAQQWTGPALLGSGLLASTLCFPPWARPNHLPSLAGCAALAVAAALVWRGSAFLNTPLLAQQPLHWGASLAWFCAAARLLRSYHQTNHRQVAMFGLFSLLLGLAATLTPQAPHHPVNQWCQHSLHFLAQLTLLRFLVDILDLSAQDFRHISPTRDSERREQTYYAAIDGIVCVAATNPQGLIVFVNDRLTAMSGYQREELIGQSNTLLCSRSDRPESLKSLAAQLAAGQAWQGEVCNRSKSGATYWLQTWVVPHRGPDGALQGHIFIQVDNTLYKRREAQLQEALSAAEHGSRLAPLTQVSVPPFTLGRLRGIHILLVEDNQTNQDIAKDLLTAEGAQVTVASDGQQAVCYLARQPCTVDLVLMDVLMPHMDGYTATARIRAELDLDPSRLPIIAMTANSAPEARLSCVAHGMNDHVSKPFYIDHLVQTIALHLSRTSSAQPPQHRPLHKPAAPQEPLSYNFAQALERFGGSKRVMALALSQFSSDYLYAPHAWRPLLAHAPSADKLQSLVRIFHTLKGNAASLGANSLAAAAATLESAISQGASTPDLETKLDAVEHALTDALREFASQQQTLQCTPSAPPASLPPPVATSPTAATEQLSHLQSELRLRSMRAVEVHASLHPTLHSLAPGLAEELHTAIDRLDFPSAEKVCESLRSKLCA